MFSTDSSNTFDTHLGFYLGGLIELNLIKIIQTP
jgi:hypothetical protein